MDVSAGLIIAAVLAGLLCLRRRPITGERDESMTDRYRQQRASKWLEKGGGE